MANVTLMYRNILETGTVTSSDANASFPLYRLYDRDLGKLFKFNSHGANLAVMVDQGAVVSYPASRLIIPVGHTLNGLDVKLQYSTTGAYGGEEVDALSWTQGDALIINKTFTVATKQYWRFIITEDPAAAPEMPELYLTNDLVFVRNPDPNVFEGRRRNIVRDETLSGKSRRVKLGESRRSRKYPLKTVESAQKTDFETWEAHCEGLKPFYILDHSGALIYMEMMNELEFTYLTPSIVSTSLDLLEVI
jgi:hypothetical protein